MTPGDRSAATASTEIVVDSALAEKAISGLGVAGSIPTRERLVLAAVYLFYAKGYEATGMAELLSYAKVNSGSFYHFFESKEELLLEVLRWYQRNLERVLIQPVYTRFQDPIDRVFGLLEGYRQRILMTDCSFGCPIGRLSLEISTERAEVHRLLAANFTDWCQAVEKCLMDAADNLPEDLERRQLAQFVLTVMEGGVMQARSYRSVAPFDSSIAQLRSYFDLLRQRAKHSTQRSRLQNRK